MKKSCLRKNRATYCLTLASLFVAAFSATTDNGSDKASETAPASDEAVVSETVAVQETDGQKVEPETRTVNRGWRIGAGVMRRSIGKATFNTRSYSSSYPIADKSARARWSGSVGNPNVVEDRIYQNGYVGRDDWTDLDGGTWNWGYDSSGQVANDMVFMEGVQKTVKSFNRASQVFSADWDKNSDNEVGVFIEAEKTMNSTRWVDYGLVVNASRASFSASGGGETFRDRQNWNTRVYYVRDSFDISGTGITPASSPYQGTESGPGPQINNVPAGRQQYSRIRSSGSYEVRNDTSSSLDMDISTVSLGLSATTRFRRLAFSGSAGPAFNIVEKEAKYEETLFESVNGEAFTPLQYWRDKNCENEYLFGAYIQGSVGLNIIGNMELSIFGRYDWLENTSGIVGLSSYSIDPSGGTFGGMLNVLF